VDEGVFIKWVLYSLGTTMKIRKINTKNNQRKGEAGQSLVELAMGLVVLLLLISGIFDVGRAIFTYFAMQDAAEEGIIYGVGFPTDCNQIIERIRVNLEDRFVPESYVVSVNIQRNDGSYATCYVIPYSEVYAGKKIHVELTVDFPITMPFIGTFIGQSIPLTATANGVILRPQPPSTP
jgi:hypothetical protein